MHCTQTSLRAADLRLRGGEGRADLETELAAVLARLHVAYPRGFYAHVERLILQWALDACDGNRIRTAAVLGIGRGSLRAKLRRHGLDVPSLGPAARS